jgi:ADP-heptose:LPS heptosyltransferase
LSNNSLISKLKIACVKGILAFENFVLRTLHFVLFSKNETSPKRILLFRTGSIGDSICAFPAISAIRKHYKNSTLHILTNAGANNLVSLNAVLNPVFYDEIIDYSSYGFLELFKIIKKNKYDLIIELPQDQVSLTTEIRNLGFFRFAGIRAAWGWQINTCFLFRQTQEHKMKFESETVRLLKLLQQNNIPHELSSQYPLNLTKFNALNAKERLREFTNSRHLVALVPGAKRPQNRYPIDRFVELAQWLTSLSYNVIVIGGAEDEERGKELCVNDHVISFCGTVSPMESAALLSNCLFCISNDTGPMHLSYAVGTPVIGLFSSRDFPNKWFPPLGNVALRNDHVGCSLCFSETCANNICMQGISIDEVKSAVHRIEAVIKEREEVFKK